MAVKSFITLASGDIILAQLACPLNDVILVYIGNNQPISLETLICSSQTFGRNKLECFTFELANTSAQV